ncbi:cytochrome C oxidase subunit IV family protein [Marinobacter subterrani]|uniref:Prokaryotic Cytochrome C oxidase subunit IV n=1 Tax=Marinobacter subterrani TaxID=1658765 RepID=A0A0J7JED2_9GAMM|nr:cytochrome C oxidase subunit IV family protein [Marinobacter subterrani]KMQ76141.1 Prokaryotic Cytochrome C oxidase subunit IV [Marinobacter subterrani]
MSTLTFKATGSWLLLIALTLLSVAASESVRNPAVMILIVVLAVIIKGQSIVDVFMGLQSAPALWRRLLLSYVIVVPATIGAVIVWL